MNRSEEITVIMTTSEALEISNAVNELYYKEDIANYFQENNMDYNTEEVLSDKDLMDKILEKYSENRRNADGGEYEDCKHWSECLKDAITEYKDQLAQYRI